jgi:hypothetical protein
MEVFRDLGNELERIVQDSRREIKAMGIQSSLEMEGIQINQEFVEKEIIHNEQFRSKTNTNG